MMANHAEDIQKHVRTYLVVFAALAALTVVTVAISYMHLSTVPAIALAMAVAITKGSLVALFFMHLIDEQKAIYWVLGLTAAFFVVLMFIPTGWKENLVTVHPVWDKLPAEGVTTHSHGHGAAAAGHGNAGHAEEEAGAQH
jgi:cytochrome c oxidase subunit 4